MRSLLYNRRPGQPAGPERRPRSRGNNRFVISEAWREGWHVQPRPQNVLNGISSSAWAPEPGGGPEWIRLAFRRGILLDGVTIVRPDTGMSAGGPVSLEFSDGSRETVHIDGRVNRFTPRTTRSLKIVLPAGAGAHSSSIAGITVNRGGKTFTLLSAAPYPPAYDIVNIEKLGVSVDIKHNLVWQDQLPASRKARHSHAQAAGMCAALALGGLDGWRLPDLEHLQRLFTTNRAFMSGRLPSGGFPPYFVAGELISGRDATPRPHVFDMLSGDIRPQSGEGFFRCVRPINDAKAYIRSLGTARQPEAAFTWSDASAYGSGLQALCGLDLEQAISLCGVAMEAGRSSGPAVPPQRPFPLEKRTLKKDEFETAAEFKARQEAEAGRVAEADAAAMESYERDLAAWRAAQNESPSEDVARMAVHAAYGSPRLSVDYDFDRQMLTGVISSSFGSFAHSVTFPLSSAYAEKFTRHLSAEELIPTVLAEVREGRLRVISVSELQNPEAFVESMDFAHALRQGRDLGPEQESALRVFLETWPESGLAVEARQKLAVIEQHKNHLAAMAAMREESRKRAQAEFEAREAVRREEERRAYAAQKNVGDRVRIDSRGFLTEYSIIGFVENRIGDRVRIRIVETSSYPPRYKGITLYRDTILWDDYQNWKLD